MDADVLNQQDMIDLAMDNLSSAILFIIIVEILFQSLISAASRNKAELEGDERDRLIALTANNSGLEFSVQERINVPMFEMPPLLFSFILAEIVRFSHQIYLYRKDAV